MFHLSQWHFCFSSDLLQNEISSGFVQCLIVALRTMDDDLALQGVIKGSYLHNKFSQLNTPSSDLVYISFSIYFAVKKVIHGDQVMQFPCHIHTLEVCISVTSDEPTLFESIYQKFFKGKLLTFVTNDAGHYLAERLFLAVSNKEIVRI